MDDSDRKRGKSLSDLFNETAREITAVLERHRPGRDFALLDRPEAAAVPQRRREIPLDDAPLQQRRRPPVRTGVIGETNTTPGFLQTSFTVTAQIVKAVVDIVKAGTQQTTKAPQTARFKKDQSHG